MRSFFISIVIVILLIGCQSSEEKIPTGKAVDINNLLSDTEWSSSKIYRVNDQLNIRLHQDIEFLYIAIDFKEVNLDEYRWVELYIDDFTKSYRFHASGQLGEQYLSASSWSENWRWGNNSMWTASTQRLAGEDRKSSTNQAYEFKFEKKKFKSEELRIYLHAFSISTKADFNAQPIETHFPINFDKYQPETWLSVVL